MKREEVYLKDIDLKDERFRISFFFSLEKLRQSLKEVGLINSPLVTYRQDRLILISGWKRVLACKALSFSSIPAWMVKTDSDLDAFLLAFHENRATREFSLLEKAEILCRLRRFGENEQKIVKHYLPLLRIPQTSYYLDLYLAISRFDRDLKSFIHEKNMSLTSLEYLAEFKPKERRLLLPLLLPLGQNKQKELLQGLREISLRNDLPVEKILTSKPLTRILDSEKLSPLQKSERIRQRLRDQRYPHLSSSEKTFEQALRKAGWPEDMTIAHSPFFEEEGITVTFRFKDEEEFKSHLKRLQQVASREGFSKVFKLPSDE